MIALFSFSTSTNHGNRPDADLYEVMSQFYKVFPDLLESDLYIAGQSFGAKYALSLAAKIDQQNMELGPHFPLKGVMLKSGLFSIKDQLEMSDNVYQAGLVDSKQHLELRSIKKVFDDQLQAKNYTEALQVWNAWSP